MSTTAHEWLELLTTDGPWLTRPVATTVWPSGLPTVAVKQRHAVREAAAVMLADRGTSRQSLIDTLLDDAFEWGGHRVTDRTELPGDQDLQPTFGFYAAEEESDDEAEPQPEWRLLGLTVDYGTHPLARRKGTSPVDELSRLLRARGVPLGIVTDGRWGG